MLFDRVKQLHPKILLDIGCGCGQFSARLAPYCDNFIVADISPALLKRAITEIPKPDISAACVDCTELAFLDNSIDTVVERFSLHHMENWRKAVDEMIRVAANHVLIEEPIDDCRSQAKRDSILAWQLYLDVQKEIGYSHFRHIQPELLLDYFKTKKNIEFEITRSDEPIPFDDFFAEFGRFADKSNRPQYWYNQLANLKVTIAARPLCESDTIDVFLKK
jgi:SAM-dependent methyltransferase